MALSDTPEKPSSDTQTKTQEKKEKPLTKVIVRRLPPTIDQETFLNQVSPIPDYDHIYTVRGDLSLGEYAFSRVYINFVNPEDVFTFKERFDNYVFVDAKGHEYPAVVEFAAFQRIPKKRNKQKTDPKCGTIESDPVYLEFLELLKQQPQQEEKPEYSLQLSASESKTEVTTPLLEYIKQRRIERQRIKEERREERKRREFERRKIREDDRRKRFEDKSPIKTVVVKPNTTKKEKEGDEMKEGEKLEATEKPAAYSGGFKNKDKKFEERKVFTSKGKYPSKPEKKEYYEKKTEYKSRRDEYKSKYQDDFKKDETKFTKKVKKYSERREERKNVAKLNEKKVEEESAADSVKPVEEKESDTGVSFSKTESNAPTDDCNKKEEQLKEAGTQQSNRSKDSDPRAQRRIRNKDRPTMAIYQPGMLSKRKQTENPTMESSGDAKPQACNENK